MLIKEDLSKPSLKICKDAGIVAFKIRHLVETFVVSSGSVSGSQRGDSNYNVQVPATIYDAGSLTVDNCIGDHDTWESKNPNIATIDENGLISKVSDGIAEFTFTERGVTKSYSVDVSEKPGSDSVYTFVSAIPGSLAEHLSQQVDNRIDNTMTMAANGLLYTTQDHATPSYIRNADFWASDVDLTCISPWNSNAGKNKAGTLITPRHILNAAHYEFPVGTVVRFVTSDNEIVERTVVAKKRHPDYSIAGYLPDFTVYTLDSDVPSTISPCKVMPSDYSDYITPGNLKDTRIGVLALDQQEKGLIRDISKNTEIEFQYPEDSDRIIFFETVISGDSGNPVFVILNGELIFLTVWTFGGAGKGSFIVNYIADINQMIADSDALAGVSTGYTLTEADFSSFPTY